MTTEIQNLGSKMSSDIFVVSGDRKQFDHLLVESEEIWKEEIKHRKVHYVLHAGMLRMPTPARVFLYGSYFKRRDWDEIDLEIKLSGHRSLLIR